MKLRFSAIITFRRLSLIALLSATALTAASCASEVMGKTQASQNAPRDFATPRLDIIGNKRSGIYHLPHCLSYSQVAPHNREYFDSESDARRAGYRRAKNCV